MKILFSFLFLISSYLVSAQCDAVTGLTATSITASGATISFTTPSVSLYFVVVYTDGVTTYRQNVNDPGAPYPHLVTAPIGSLAQETEYDYYVVRYCSVDDSSTTSTLSFTTLEGQCDSVSNVIVTTTSSTATVTSSEAAYGTSYIIKYVKQGYTDTASKTGATADFSLTGLKSGSTYYYYIRTYCGGDSAQNTTKTFLTKNSPNYTPQTGYGAQFERILARKMAGYPAVNGEPSVTVDGKNDYPSIVQDTTNAEVYHFNPKTQTYFKSNIDVVDNIAALKAHKLTPRRIFVKDSIRGGNFTLREIPDITEDGGIYFNADSIGADWYWVREIAQTGGYLFEWWGLQNDSTIDQSSVIQTAINYTINAKGNEIRFSKPGTYLCGDIIIRGNKLSITGPNGWSVGEPADQLAVTLKRNTDDTVIFRLRGARGLLIEGIQFNGNLSNDENGIGIAIKSDSVFTSSGILIQKCKFFEFKTAILASDDSGWRIYFSTIRNNWVGISRMRDGEIANCNFSANANNAIYLNNGQTRINLCFFEFTGNGGDGGVAAINIDGNSDRIQVTGCTFDRNQTFDIYVHATEENTPENIQIVGNHFKRTGWYDSIAPGDMTCIMVRAAKGINIVGNQTWSAGYGAAGIEGVYAPMYFAKFENTHDIVVKSNNYHSLKIKVDLQNINQFVWIESAVANEWYLRRAVFGNTTYDPWLAKYNNFPDYIGYDSAILASGTVGSLAVAQWAYADNDALGWNTIYVRLTADADPNDYGVDSGLYAYFDHRGVTFDLDCYDIETDDSRDKTPNAYIDLPASGGTESFYMWTRSRTDASRADAYTLVISGRQRTSNVMATFEIPIMIRRSGAAVVATATIGDIQSPLAGFTIGETSADDLTITARPDVIGTRMRITLTNNSANIIDFSAFLKW